MIIAGSCSGKFFQLALMSRREKSLAAARGV
jgi:hypothetical protein